MEPALPEKLRHATEALLHQSYAVNRLSGDDIRSILYEASFSRDYPPSIDWVAPFVKMTAACGKQIADWQFATFDLEHSAERVAPFLVEQKCESECIAVYELLVEFLIETHPPKSSFVEDSNLEELARYLSPRDAIVEIALILHENLTRLSRCKSNIQRVFDDWVSARRGGLWSAQYMLSAVHATVSCVPPSLYERMEFRKGFEDRSLRQLHLKTGWPLLKTAFSKSDRDLIMSLFV